MDLPANAGQPGWLSYVGSFAPVTGV